VWYKGISVVTPPLPTPSTGSGGATIGAGERHAPPNFFKY